MSEAESVVRCPSCGGPLSGTQGKMVVRCRYCDSECRLGSRLAEEQAKESRELFARAAEAERIQAEAASRLEELEAKMEEAVAQGRREDAVRYFEGYMRLQVLAAQHIQGDAFDYLDEVVRPAVADFAKNMGVDYPQE